MGACNKIEAAIKELDTINSAELIAELKCYRSIAASMGEFLGVVADRNNPDIKELVKEIAKVIFRNG